MSHNITCFSIRSTVEKETFDIPSQQDGIIRKIKAPGILLKLTSIYLSKELKENKFLHLYTSVMVDEITFVQKQAI